MSRFYLVRHGERAGAPDALVGRSTGFPLTEKGQRQAQAAAEHLRGVKLSRIYSSPSERCQQTAHAIARVAQREIVTAPELDEADFGAWTGRTYSSLHGDDLWRLYNTHRSRHRPPSGESMLDVQVRCVGALLRWRDAHPGEHIAVVTHAEPIRAILLYLIGAPIDHWNRLQIQEASITLIDLEPEFAHVVVMNATAHL